MPRFWRRLMRPGIVFMLTPCIACVVHAATTGYVEIPVSFDHANIPIVDVLVDRQRLKLYLDTGARGLHLPKSVADGISGVQLTGRKITSIDLAGKVRADEAFSIAELRMAGMSFREVSGQYLSAWGLGRAEYELPVIGLNVLLQKELVIDFPHKRILLSDDTIDFDALYPAVHTLPLTHADEGLVISAKVGSNEWPYVLDTGASISITKTSASIDASLITPCSIPLPEGRCEAVDARVESGTLSIPLQLIRMPLPEKFKPMGIIGNDLFSRCALYLGRGSSTLKISCANE